MNTTTLTHCETPAPLQEPGRRAMQTLGASIGRVWKTWHQQRSRTAHRLSLDGLSDARLRDLGIGDVYRPGVRPERAGFWNEGRQRTGLWL